MKLVRTAMPGTIARAFSSMRRKIAPEPPRFMRFSVSAEACCRGTSKYLAMLSWAAIVSRRRVVTLFG